MRKKLLALTLALVFAAASVITAYAFNCKVVSIENTEVVLKCKTKDANKLSAGQEANVKKKVEGC
jgi:hypothetical protein